MKRKIELEEIKSKREGKIEKRNWEITLYIPMSSANQVGQLDNNTSNFSNAIVPCACTMTSMIELVYLRGSASHMEVQV